MKSIAVSMMKESANVIAIFTAKCYSVSISDLLIDRVRDHTRKRKIEWNSIGCVLDELLVKSNPSPTGVGKFVETLICAVPMQIARAENGQFILMNDGKSENCNGVSPIKLSQRRR